MGKTGHHLTGAGTGVLIGTFLVMLGYPLIYCIGAIISGWAGGTAPDWLEIARAQKTNLNNYERKSLIPHRTITHWWPIWIIPLSFLVFEVFYTHESFEGLFISFLIISFIFGALTHLLMDVPNPMGIPIKLPFKKYRYSLHLWNSGNFMEVPFALVYLSLTVLFFLFLAF